MDHQVVQTQNVLKTLGKSLENKSSGEIQIETGFEPRRGVLLVSVSNYDVDRSMDTLENIENKPLIFRCGVIYHPEANSIEIKQSEGSIYYIDKYEELINQSFMEIAY